MLVGDNYWNVPITLAVQTVEKPCGSTRTTTRKIAFNPDGAMRKLLSWAGARVVCTDPYVEDDRLVSLEQVVAESDILVLGAPHKGYRGLEIGGKDVVDVWGALGEGIRL